MRGIFLAIAISLVSKSCDNKQTDKLDSSTRVNDETCIRSNKGCDLSDVLIEVQVYYPRHGYGWKMCVKGDRSYELSSFSPEDETIIKSGILSNEIYTLIDTRENVYKKKTEYEKLMMIPGSISIFTNKDFPVSVKLNSTQLILIYNGNLLHIKDWSPASPSIRGMQEYNFIKKLIQIVHRDRKEKRVRYKK